MPFSFKAKIYKVGINPCVKVPIRITKNMTPTKGYIPITGTIGNYPFEQTLCPVKNEGYRLYVNGPMLKGAKLTIGQSAHFTIEQAAKQRDADIPMIPILKRKLQQEELFEQFKKFTPSRKKEVLRYLHNLKTRESLERNIEKLVNAMKGNIDSQLLRNS